MIITVKLLYSTTISQTYPKTNMTLVLCSVFSVWLALITEIFQHISKGHVFLVSQIIFSFPQNLISNASFYKSIRIQKEEPNLMIDESQYLVTVWHILIWWSILGKWIYTTVVIVNFISDLILVWLQTETFWLFQHFGISFWSCISQNNI